MVSLTPKAAEKIKILAQRQNLPGGFLRVRVTAGGCAGLNYEFEISNQSAQGDVVAEAHGAKVVTDFKGDFYIGGSIIDYMESLMKSGFVIQNPNAVSTCACGTSFST